VLSEVYLTGEADDLRAALRTDDPGGRLRVFSGYSGWGPGQLNAEIRAGGWILDRADPRSVFSPDGSDLWQRVYQILERLEARAASRP
jgi:putative transcriptional regulator